jgi:hypothetical protein
VKRKRTKRLKRNRTKRQREQDRERQRRRRARLRAELVEVRLRFDQVELEELLGAEGDQRALEAALRSVIARWRASSVTGA